MKKSKKIVVLCASVVAVLAIAVGLCCFFFAEKPVRDVPQTLEIQVIENEPHLVAEYRSGYGYEFKIEQKFEGEYVLIENISSEINNINLAQQNIQLVSGQEFRFSVRYTYENEKGQWSQQLEWKI